MLTDIAQSPISETIRRLSAERRSGDLQVRSGPTVVSVKCEKQQVGALAEYLAGVVADLPPAEPATTSMDLVAPILAEWVVGGLSVAFDETSDRIVLVVDEAIDETGLDPDGPMPEAATIRLRLTRSQVVSYATRAAQLVQGGRPACPLCGHPEGQDHACPKTNGHGPPR